MSVGELTSSYVTCYILMRELGPLEIGEIGDGFTFLS